MCGVLKNQIQCTSPANCQCSLPLGRGAFLELHTFRLARTSQASLHRALIERLQVGSRSHMGFCRPNVVLHNSPDHQNNDCIDPQPGALHVWAVSCVCHVFASKDTGCSHSSDTCSERPFSLRVHHFLALKALSHKSGHCDILAVQSVCINAQVYQLYDFIVNLLCVV